MKPVKELKGGKEEDMALIQIPRWKCERCGHEWIPRSEEEPTKCPRCHSPYWNKARVRNIQSTNRK